MACATLFYLQPAGTASSQGTDCSFGTPLMPGTKEELSRGQCQRAEVRAAASSLSWQARPLFLTYFVAEHSANIQHTQITFHAKFMELWLKFCLNKSVAV